MTNKLDYEQKLDELMQEAHYFADLMNLKSHSFHNDSVDAFRHAYSSAIMTLEWGELADSLLGLAHELKHKNPTDERMMDLYNNEVGRDIATNFLSNIENSKFKGEYAIKERIAQEIAQAVKDNKTVNSLDDKRIQTAIKNKKSHPLRVYTREEIDKMSLDEFATNEKDILKNISQGKILTKAEADNQVQSGNLVWVDDYVRDDGTQVSGYYRRKVLAY